MKVGTKNLVEDPVTDEDYTNSLDYFFEEEGKKNKIPNVQLKFTDLPPNSKLENCIETQKFPHMKFPFKYFNPTQSSFFPEVENDNNVVVCGRTSAGKTTIAEMAISYTLNEIRKQNPEATAAYISPLKALTSEKEQDWTKITHDFYQYNISILTGDYILTDERKEELAKADIICMSSEMLGSRIRRNKSEKNTWINRIKVLVCDESHLISQDNRGPNLEVALMKFTKVNPDCRIIFLSATMPNVEELGEWLTKLNGKNTTIVKSSYRPVDLKWNFETYEEANYYQATERNKISSVLSIINRYPKDKFIVFVHTKKTGKMLLKLLEGSNIVSKFYNANLSKEARDQIGKSFMSKDKDSLRILISTSSLAYGINLPARRVIIVGLYRGMSKVDAMDIIQEAGRAGRVGLDTAGDVHMLISDANSIKEEEYCKTMPPIISKIDNRSILAFHLVSEIAEKNVTNEKEAISWYVRSLAYHQNFIINTEEYQIFTKSIIKSVIEELIKYGALKRDVHGDLKPTIIGRIASWFYLNPFDVSCWANNFSKILKFKKVTEADISWAMANTYTASTDYGFKIDHSFFYRMKDEINPSLRFEKTKGEGVEKHMFALYAILKGKDDCPVTELYPTYFTYLADKERIAQAIEVLGSRSMYFDSMPSEHVIWELPYRLRYGLGNKGLELLLLPRVGRKTAIDIMKRRVSSCKELVSAQTMGIKILSDKRWKEVEKEAIEIARIGHIAYIKKQKQKRKNK